VREDAARALRLLREATDAGSAEASFHLGVMREYGRGAKPDFSEAARLYAQAAQLDEDGRRVPDARYYLGLLYDQGRGVPRSSKRASECFSAAAEAGSAPAMLALARLHAQGRPGVVDVDYGLALRWLHAAAAADDPRVSGEARMATRELQSLLDAVETRVREQERQLGVPLRVAVGQIQGGS
jgi:TPR repeat protein